MIQVHTLHDCPIDLEPAVSAHSGDKTIVYKTVADEQLRAAYYYPPDFRADEKHPCLICIHGGGWGSRKIFPDQSVWSGDYLGYLARFLSMRGFVCVSISYRLKRGLENGYQLIDLYDDCADAVASILQSADENGIDADNISLLGESAGGHLVGAVAAFDYACHFTFRKALMVNPITDMREGGWIRYVPEDSTHPRLKDFSFDEKCLCLSPLAQLKASTSPIVLIHGLCDTVVDPSHSRRFYDKAVSLGVPCELHLLEDTNHAFLLAEYTKNIPACKVGVEIVCRSLGVNI